MLMTKLRDLFDGIRVSMSQYIDVSQHPDKN